MQITCLSNGSTGLLQEPQITIVLNLVPDASGSHKACLETGFLIPLKSISKRLAKVKVSQETFLDYK